MLLQMLNAEFRDGDPRDEFVDEAKGNRRGVHVPHLTQTVEERTHFVFAVRVFHQCFFATRDWSGGRR